MYSIGKTYCFWILLWALGPLVAQEEGSADLFTDSYTDRFQEVFFEAIKQKGIENYDRAEALFLEAKKLDPLSPVIDHELAKVLFLAKRYPQAERYALDAVRARPGEYWFVQTLMDILDQQSKSPEDYSAELPLDLPELRMNFASWYLGAEKWDEAEKQLAPLPASKEVGQMRTLIARSRLSEHARQNVASENKGPAEEEGSLGYFERIIREALDEDNWKSAEEASGEALERYPLQPYFYYAKGISRLRQGDASEAIRVLEEGEGVLLGDSDIAQLIYKALAEAYTQLGNMEKAGNYLNKLKKGS